jgi:tetratricopeptide (TPR) repeat protein
MPVDRGRLGGAFCDLHRQGFTGMLRVDSAGREALIGFRDGLPVSIEDSQLRGLLGEELVERGTLTRAQYAAVIARVTEGLVDHEDLAFCEHACALGYLSEEEARSELSERTRTQLIKALAMRNCQLTLDEGEDWLAMGPGEYPQEVGAIVYMGVRTFYDDGLLRGYVPELEQNYLRLLASPASVGEFFALDDDEVKLLRAVDPESPIDTLVHASILEPDHALAVLALLRIAQLGEFSNAPFAKERSGARLTAAVPPRAERIGSRNGMPAVQAGRPAPQTAMNAVSETQGARTASRTGMAATAPGTGQYGSRNDMRAVTVPSGPDDGDRAASRSASQTALPAAVDKTSHTAIPAQRVSPEAGRPYRSKPSTRAAAAESGADAVQANPAPVLDATQEALREAAARASRQGRRGPTAIAPRVAREPEAKPVESPPTDPSTRGEYAKAHLNELIQRRRQTRQASSELYPGAKRDTARELRQAQDMLRDQHYARAEDILRGLTEFEPSNELFRTLRLWAKFRAQPELDDAQTGELVDLAKKLIQTPEHGPFACYMLGHLYMAGKKDELAEKYFRRAHTADKTNKDAERHLLILERRKQQAAEAESASNRKIFGIAISSNKQKP